jgi:hypothetical protein
MPKVLDTTEMSASEAKSVLLSNTKWGPSVVKLRAQACFRWITLKKIKYRDAVGKEVHGPSLIALVKKLKHFYRDFGNVLNARRANHVGLMVGFFPSSCSESAIIYHSNGYNVYFMNLGVAIFAILRSQTNAFPPSTVLVEQYRPPIDKVIIGKFFSFARQTSPRLIFLDLNRTTSRSEMRSIELHACFHSFQGLIDEGETPEQAAIRELKEETGYTADRVVEASPLLVTDPGLC